MKRRKTVLLVGTLAVALSIGAIGIVASSGNNYRLSASAVNEPLVLDVIKDTVRNGDANTVVTTKGTTLSVDSKIEANSAKPGWYSLRSFANLDRIGNIKGINFEFNGVPTPAAYKISYGYEADEEGNPIYVKEGIILPDGPVEAHKLEFAFSSLTDLANPNFFKVELRNPTWAAAPIKTLQVLYGNKTGIGDNACTASVTPKQFANNAVIDFTDPMKNDVKMSIDTIYAWPERNNASYKATLTGLKKADKFFIKLGDEVADPGNISLLSEFIVKNSDNSLSVIKDIDGKTNIILKAAQDGTINATIEILGSSYVQKEFFLFGTHIMNSTYTYWSDYAYAPVYNNDKTYTFAGLVTVLGEVPTEFVVKTKANPNYEIPCKLYETADTIATMIGQGESLSHIRFTAAGTFDVIVNDSAETLAVKIVPHVAA